MGLMMTGKLFQLKRAGEREKTGDIWILKISISKTGRTNLIITRVNFMQNESMFQIEYLSNSYVDPVTVPRVLDQKNDYIL